VTLLFFSWLDPPAKMHTWGWLKGCYHISVGHELLVTSSLSHGFYAAPDWNKLNPPKSVYSPHVQTQRLLPLQTCFCFVRESWVFLFTVGQVMTSPSCPCSIIFNEPFLLLLFIFLFPFPSNNTKLVAGFSRAWQQLSVPDLLHVPATEF